VANVVGDALSRIPYTQDEQRRLVLEDVGTSNRLNAADYLNVVELCISPSTEWLDNVRKCYKEDAIFSPVRQYLSDSTSTGNESKKADSKQAGYVKERAKSYTLEEGLLYDKPLGGKLYIR